jgi:hypothetical protein
VEESRSRGGEVAVDKGEIGKEMWDVGCEMWDVRLRIEKPGFRCQEKKSIGLFILNSGF